jgi:hypothetical protein
MAEHARCAKRPNPADAFHRTLAGKPSRSANPSDAAQIRKPKPGQGPLAHGLSMAGGVVIPPVLVADCGYGEVGEFRGGLDDREIADVVNQVFALTRSLLVPS